MDEVQMPRVSYLTTRAHKAFALAHELAERHGHTDATTLHLALAIVRHLGVPAGALHNLGVSLDEIESDLEAQLSDAGPPLPAPAARAWSEWDQRMIARAHEEAKELDVPFYGTEHLLLAIAREESEMPARVLANHGVQREDLQREIRRMYKAET